jgi:hypothetical protein
VNRASGSTPGALAGVAFAVALLTPGFLNAQTAGPAADSVSALGPVRWGLGVSLLGAQPVGEFADYVGQGGGFSMFGVFRLGDRESWKLRVDLEVISYGSTTLETPLSPSVPLVDLSVTTENAIGSLALGPELVLGDGRFRPHLNASVGLSQFVTTTSVWGSGQAFPLVSTKNHETHTYVLTAGGGVRIGISEERPHPVVLDLGARYVHHGLTDYLREGGLSEGPNGEVLMEPIRSGTNLITLHLGVEVGFR